MVSAQPPLDRIIQEFASHAFGGTLIQESSQTVAANEEIFRSMARESRIARVFLTAKMVERWKQFEENKVTYRLVASLHSPTRCMYSYLSRIPSRPLLSTARYAKSISIDTASSFTASTALFGAWWYCFGCW